MAIVNGAKALGMESEPAPEVARRRTSLSSICGNRTVPTTTPSTLHYRTDGDVDTTIVDGKICSREAGPEKR
jgi:cytosine/adenosine deaminase-related metal-dependent hydrolase